MQLSTLLNKKRTGEVATAIPAISATAQPKEAPTVARIATIAVANACNEKTNTIAPLSVADEAKIMEWFSMIGETDQVEIARVMDKCRRDPETRLYCLKQHADPYGWWRND